MASTTEVSVSMQHLGPTDLCVIKRLQRDYSIPKSRKMSKSWSNLKALTLIITPCKIEEGDQMLNWETGEYVDAPVGQVVNHIADGQGRALAKFGPGMPSRDMKYRFACVVVTPKARKFCTPAEVATVFTAFNRDRQGVGIATQFKLDLVKGETWAIDIRDAAQSVGLTVGEVDVAARGKHVEAVGALLRIYRLGAGRRDDLSDDQREAGKNLLKATLTLTQDLYPMVALEQAAIANGLKPSDALRQRLGGDWLMGLAQFIWFNQENLPWLYDFSVAPKKFTSFCRVIRAAYPLPSVAVSIAAQVANDHKRNMATNETQRARWIAISIARSAKSGRISGVVSPPSIKASDGEPEEQQIGGEAA